MLDLFVFDLRIDI